jgi:hypothetical protein
MFPQPKKYGHYVVAAVFAVFVFKNPEKAAQFINHAIDTVSQFAGALG